MLWRLSILLLPWQTRWIFVRGSIFEFAWEQGTVSVYVSQVLLIATIFVGVVLFRDEWKRFIGRLVNSERRAGQNRKTLIADAIALFAIATLATTSWIASGMWCVQVFILTAFFATLFVASVSARSVATWFVISIFPHAMLGIYQYAVQDILGSSFLGIATHRPWISGTSVVEHGLYRVLRAYGGFPHPNILGGWLALGLTLLPWLIRQARTKQVMLAYVFTGVIVAAAFVFTFSRGAWIAGLLGIACAVPFAWTRSTEQLQKQALILFSFLIVFTLSWAAVMQWDHIEARFTSAHRLERWSLETRSNAILEGIEAWKLRPVAGWGVGASLVGITAVRMGDSFWSAIAPEPPHAVPFVVLLETGVLGAIALAALAFAMMQWFVRKRRWEAIPILAILGVVSFTDHYLWTLWPGMVLAAYLVTFLCRLDTEDGTH